MKIMVFDVPAENGGALSVLHDFYNDFKDDENNDYIFVLSLPELKETPNIKVLKFPWIKRSWVHRLYFDYFVAPKLIKRYKVEKVLSLQNIIVPYTKIHQSLYVHNALPFSEYRFTLGEDKLLWIYQNIIGKFIMKSIKKADHIIVQTNWMKKEFVEKLKINATNIEVKRPKVNIKIKEPFNATKESLSTFFYPASGVVFKNHKVIIDACLRLKEEGINDYKVIFTLHGNENKYITEIFNTVKENDLPIEFFGYMSQNEVFKYYSKSILIFPSLIETYGLPLLEAKMHNTPIIVYEKSFSKEILFEYEYVDFISESEIYEVSQLMKKYIIQGGAI